MSKLISKALQWYCQFFTLVSYSKSPFLLLVRLYWGWQPAQSGWRVAHPSRARNSWVAYPFVFGKGWALLRFLLLKNQPRRCSSGCSGRVPHVPPFGTWVLGLIFLLFVHLDSFDSMTVSAPEALFAWKRESAGVAQRKLPVASLLAAKWRSPARPYFACSVFI
jgi:hypothetical protein